MSSRKPEDEEGGKREPVGPGPEWRPERPGQPPSEPPDRRSVEFVSERKTRLRPIGEGEEGEGEEGDEAEEGGAEPGEEASREGAAPLEEDELPPAGESDRQERIREYRERQRRKGRGLVNEEE